MKSLAKRYLIAAVALAALLTVFFVFTDRSATMIPGAYLFAMMEVPGAILRPDAWLFHHPRYTPIVTSALAAITWILPIFVVHMLVRAIRKRPR